MQICTLIEQSDQIMELKRLKKLRITNVATYLPLNESNSLLHIILITASVKLMIKCIAQL